MPVQLLSLYLKRTASKYNKEMNKLSYLVVDDDTTNNLICEFTVRRFDKDAGITLFTKPEIALEFIENNPQPQEVILFLDINMPTMTGFEFLKEFEKFDSETRNKYRIYILTSSIEDFSSQAICFPMVNGFLSKPLKLSYLEEISENRGTELLIKN